MATNYGGGNPGDQGPQDPSGGGGVNPLLGILATLGSAIASHAIAGNSASGNVPPELRQLLALSNNRMASQTPLFNAVNQGTFSMLPTFAKSGIDQSNTAVPSVAPMSGNGSGGGMNPLLAAALGAGGGAAMSNIPFDKVLEALKGLFGHGASVQGNQPYSGGTGLPSFGSDPTQFGGWDPGVSDPSGQPYLPSDPGVYYGESGAGAYPTDPSGGTGVGPGMQAYYGDY